jgi:GxxExxY protein
MTQRRVQQDWEDGKDALSHAVIGCCFDVMNELGWGFLESVYSSALRHALNLSGIPFESEITCPVLFRNHCIAEFRMDLLVDRRLVVELKAVQGLLPEHSAQVINYLKASGHPHGLLVNFGRPRIEFRRLHHPSHPPHPVQTSSELSP